MGTTVQQVAGETSTTPTNGQPWNFTPLLDSVLIPRVVAADSKLLPGARLLWGIIRQYSPRDGRCFASDETLARAVGVHWRQLVRYCRALERAGLLQTTPRPGKTPVRELLWDARFTISRRKGVSSETGGVVLEDRGGCPPGQPHIRKNGILSGSLSVSPAAAKQKSPEPAPAPPAEKPAAEWSEEDYRARGRLMGFPEHIIERDIERVRARRARPQAERTVKASEVTAELVASNRR
jgi:Helix-turn-helix domain